MEVNEFFRLFAAAGVFLTAVLLLMTFLAYPPDSDRI